MNNVYLGFGTNLGERIKNIDSAIKELSPFVQFEKFSSIWETSPWGIENQPYFLNCTALCKTQLSPTEVLQKIHNIEMKNCRSKKKEKFDPRSIDIDILFYNNEIINTEELTIPHPLLHKRKFVLLPLSEIANSLIHPVFKKTIKELSQSLNSNEKCKLIEDSAKVVEKNFLLTGHNC